jgi:hypothetical protein
MQELIGEGVVVDRIPGYSDQMMYDRCERMYAVCSKEKEVVVGRGKAAVRKKVLQYRNIEPILEALERSMEFYKDKMKFEFRDYQLEIMKKAESILIASRFVYIAMEVRTGKTLTSLGICELLKPKKVLFVTKKKAITTIQRDYDLLNPNYVLDVINYESLHTIPRMWYDVIILDEAHGMGAFPKPSNRAKIVAEFIAANKPYVILLSGTPTPESYSQMYHQVYSIPRNPFNKYANFYKFAADHVDVKERTINSLRIRDYSHGKDSILEAMSPYMISYTQKAAGFESSVEEEVLYVRMKPKTYDLIKRLKKDLVIEGKSELILGDTPVKLMQKVHQLCSGTIKFESGNSMIVDTTKAEFIKEKFADSRIGIFYKFKEELNALKSVFEDTMTTDLDKFDNEGYQVIALQIVSGREGISLRNADYLVYYNIDFSATSYWQSRDRMTTKERAFNKVYWIFAEGGIEKEIYKTVSNKKDFTVNHFKKLI